MARPIGGRNSQSPSQETLKNNPSEGQKCRHRRPNLLPQERHARVMDGPVQQTRAGTGPQTAKKTFFLRILGLAFHHPILPRLRPKAYHVMQVPCTPSEGMHRIHAPPFWLFQS